VLKDSGEKAGGEGAAGSWRTAFLDAPYLFNALVSMGVVVDTFETACTWDRFDELHRAVISSVRRAMKEVAGGGVISCRFTHVYPDGPAPYYTFIAPGRRGGELEQHEVIKRAASDALIEHGATITHHHAVGRLHRPWYDRQRPELFASVLRAAKRELDPAAVLNPGVLID
jgi:alkyldihydroxyacetonephosphate synthase